MIDDEEVVVDDDHFGDADPVPVGISLSQSINVQRAAPPPQHTFIAVEPHMSLPGEIEPVYRVTRRLVARRTIVVRVGQHSLGVPAGQPIPAGAEIQASDFAAGNVIAQDKYGVRTVIREAPRFTVSVRGMTFVVTSTVPTFSVLAEATLPSTVVGNEVTVAGHGAGVLTVQDPDGVVPPLSVRFRSTGDRLYV